MCDVHDEGFKITNTVRVANSLVLSNRRASLRHARSPNRLMTTANYACLLLFATGMRYVFLSENVCRSSLSRTRASRTA